MTTRNINALADAQALGWADARFTRLAANSVSLNGRMSFSGQSLTGSQADSLLGLAATWNTTGTPTAFDLNVTDTASDAASKLLDLRVGGVSRVSISKTGAITTLNAVTADTFRTASATVLHFVSGGTTAAILAANGWKVISTGSFSWSGQAYNSTADLFLARDAANTLAQRNGANAQAFNLYNTFTNASNYERGFMRWSANVLEIGTEAGGTGTERELRIVNTLVMFGTSSSATINSDANGLYLGGTSTARFRADQVRLGSNTVLSFGGVPSGTPDINLTRNAAGILKLAGNSTGGALQFQEMTAPAAPATNEVRIFAEDDGSGKTRLMALFATGAAQQIAIQP